MESSGQRLYVIKKFCFFLKSAIQKIGTGINMYYNDSSETKWRLALCLYSLGQTVGLNFTDLRLVMESLIPYKRAQPQGHVDAAVHISSTSVLKPWTDNTHHLTIPQSPALSRFSLALKSSTNQTHVCSLSGVIPRRCCKSNRYYTATLHAGEIPPSVPKATNAPFIHVTLARVIRTHTLKPTWNYSPHQMYQLLSNMKY